MKKTTALMAMSLGVAALALTACGGSTTSAVDPSASAVIPEVTATTEPTAPATPVATGAPEQATTSNDPLQSTDSKKVSATIGEKVTLKGSGKAPSGGGLAVISSDSVVLKPVGAVDMKNASATFTAAKAGKARVAIGFTDGSGKFTNDWTVYEVTIK